MSGVGQQDTVQAPMKPTKPEFGRMQMGANRANSRTQPQTQIQTQAKPMNRNCSNEMTKPRENTIMRQFTELEKMLMDFEEPPYNIFFLSHCTFFFPFSLPLPSLSFIFFNNTNSNLHSSNNPSGSLPSTKNTEKGIFKFFKQFCLSIFTHLSYSSLFSGITNDEFDEALKILDEI